MAVGKRHRFRGPWALRDIDLELRAGTVVEFAGPDGAGKSSLLALIAGSDEPSAGTITRTHGSTAYSPEDLPSGLLLTGRTYLRNMAMGNGHRVEDANARVDAIAAGLGLTDALLLPLSTLNARASQQIALCRTLAHPSRLIVLDDPWSRLDPIARDFLAEELTARAAAGACVVVTDEGPRPDSFRAHDHYELADGLIRTRPA